MGFFDTLGESLTNAGKDMAKKANEIAKVTSLNGQISSQESLMDGIFKEIGKMIFDNKDNWKDLDLAEILGKLDTAKSEIERLKEEIQNVKNASAAPAEAPAAAPAEAPAPVEAPAPAEAPATNNCPNCGAALDNGAVFCSSCGTKVQE